MATQLYDFSTVRGSWVGAISETLTPTRMYIVANAAFFIAEVTGTEALIRMKKDSSSPAGMLEVSVDGGAYVQPPVAGEFYTVFTGLSDTTHSIVVKARAAYANSAYMPDDGGDVFSVTGAAPSVEFFAGTAALCDDTYALTTGVHKAAPTSFLPPRIPDATTNNYTRAAFTTSATKIYVTKRFTTTDIYVSVDGAAPVQYSCLGSADIGHVLITSDGAEHTFNVYSTTMINTVSANSALTPASYRINQYGDSITVGAGATNSDVEIHRVAAYYGAVGGTFGWSGWTISDLLTALPGFIANQTIAANDIAVLAIGRNDVNAIVGNQPTLDNYESIITLLVNAGYSKVICRAIIRGDVDDWAADNAALESVVTGIANPDVVFLPTIDWTGIDLADSTHPSAAGYDTMEAYAITDYAPYLPGSVDVEPTQFSMIDAVTAIHNSIFMRSYQ